MATDSERKAVLTVFHSR